MAGDKNSDSHEIIKYLHIENAKKLSFVMVIGFILYHGIIHFKYSSDSCKWLINDGRYQGYKAWQPYGCMMHKYTKSDSRNCMHYVSFWGGRNRFAFVGDSRIRQLYFAFINTLSTTSQNPYKAHSNLTFEDKSINLLVEFIWSPMVNQSMFDVYLNWMKMNKPTERPNIVITGSALWSIKIFNGSIDGLRNFKINLTMVKYFFNKLNTTTKIYWMLQDPVVEKKLSLNRSMITNKQIDLYNNAALDILHNTKADIWRSSRLIAQGHSTDSVDGLHIGKVALQWDVQTLINVYCNNHMNPRDGTCCNKAETVTVVQLIVGFFFIVCMLVAVVLVMYRKKQVRRIGKACRSLDNGGKAGESNENSLCYKPSAANECLHDVFVSLAKLGVIMAYMFLCDRTNFFMKENKNYSHSNFFLPFAYVMILGLFFNDDSKQTAVLHRDQTDEWKGWMQLVILIYHVTGASKILPIYVHIRVLVTSYLFLTGYGHFFYFYKKADYGLYRLCQVLFRMNLLVIVLCFVMNRPYQFYYFVPLVSFWFLVVYITMALWPQVSTETLDNNLRHALYMIIKVIFVGTVITLLYSSEVLFEKIFLARPFKPLFVLSDDSIHEWRFRWMLDRYSVLYGMLLAFGYLILKKLDLLDDNKRNTLFSKGIMSAVLLLSLAAIAGYTTFASLCRNKKECNEIHPYISFVPILGFVCLRNITGWMRVRYSPFFAWFGKISLELFIGQYHIWLAADTHGVLVLIPDYPVLNLVMTSFIFVCIAHEIHKVTEVLAEHVVPQNWTSICRNLTLFLMVVIPVSISKGAYS